ncbi:MAG TPA: ATP-dependent zinc metalloprotease FtsH [Bryobacteraceae bacterium]|nr:ATP-dependent zinc metalloprotease FtsH [Bryobacteraceae bacterium]
MSSNVKTAVFWVVIVCAVALVYMAVKTGRGPTPTNLKVSDFVAYVQDGKIKDADITGTDVSGTFTDGGVSKQFHTVIPPNYPKIYDLLQDKGVKYTWKESTGSGWIGVLFNAVPLLILLGLWIFMMRQMQSGGNKALSFGKSRARLHSSQQKKVSFKDVAGVDEAKEELQEIIEFLREPQKFQKLGGRIPKGVLLIGPPGTGKTLLARAIAGEANVPFFSISGSDFVEMFVGVGASRVRDLFEQGKKNAPCIIFIDEIDAVGRHRGAGLGGGHDEREQTLNQLLVEMDGFESNEGVILVAATNRPDVLDPALLRPGRFDRRVVVDRPDVRGRESILKVHTKKVPLSDDVDLSVIARGTPGFAGADLANLVNEAALVAARQNRKVVTQWDFELAKDKVLMGVERKSLIISDKEKRMTAFHEAGHALVAALIEHADPLHKVTIIPRGMALGLTMQLPIDDKLSHDKKYLEARLAILMAGRIAEEIFLDQMTTGAGNDIERATEMAHKMVCEWGMSELGPLSFGKKDEQIFLGREIAQHRDYSEETAIKIDQQVRKLVEDGYNTAKGIIQGRSEAMVKIAEALLEREVLDAAEVTALINGKTLPKLPPITKPNANNPPDGGLVIAPHQTGLPGLVGGESPQPA